jgi:GntR family transcriptional regulator of vanillate catabolism
MPGSTPNLLVRRDIVSNMVRPDEPAAATNAAAITEILRERLLSGEIRSGEHLHQVPLAEMLGVSRTPLREALANLARDRLLEFEPHRGYTVRRFQLQDVQQAFAVRERLEALACGLCAQAGLPPAVLEALASCVAAGDAVLAKRRLDPDDLPVYRAMNVNFHETILEQSGNRWALDFVRQTHNVPMASDRVFVWEDYEVIRRSHDDHHRILHALRSRDVARAEALMREHIFFAGQVLAQAAERLSPNVDGVEFGRSL